jgi:hypothetical protein
MQIIVCAVHHIWQRDPGVALKACEISLTAISAVSTRDSECPYNAV